jgi:L-ribulokinase
MFGAVAAGSARGGYASIYDAAQRMACLKKETFRPSAANQAVYERLYREYKALYDEFGRGANDVMKRLKKIKADALAKG